MTKKVVIHVVTVYHAAKFCLLHIAQMQLVLYAVHRHSAPSGSPHDAVASVW